MSEKINRAHIENMEEWERQVRKSMEAGEEWRLDGEKRGDLQRRPFHTYDDIINLPHHVSESHPPMSYHDRAAQFSPFAALSGFEGAVKETARLTEQKLELDEGEKMLLDEKLQLIRLMLPERPFITVTWFVPDERKKGGSYQTVSGRVREGYSSLSYSHTKYVRASRSALPPGLIFLRIHSLSKAAANAVSFSDVHSVSSDRAFFRKL